MPWQCNAMRCLTAYQLLLLCFDATTLSEKRRNKRFLTNQAKWYFVLHSHTGDERCDWLACKCNPVNRWKRKLSTRCSVMMAVRGREREREDEMNLAARSAWLGEEEGGDCAVAGACLPWSGTRSVLCANICRSVVRPLARFTSATWRSSRHRQATNTAGGRRWRRRVRWRHGGLVATQKLGV